MATKIEGRSFDAPIKSYNFDGHDYNTLRVHVDYDKSGWQGGYFSATLTPEYIEVHNGYQTRGFHVTGTRDPLGSWMTIRVKDAPKNSQKTIVEISAALEQAKDAIAYYFDQRNWVRLQWLVESVGRSGYTPTIADLVKGDMEKTNDNSNNLNNSETMATNAKGADLIGKTIVVVNNDKIKYVIKSIEGDKLMTDFCMEGREPMPCPVPMEQVTKMVDAGTWCIEDAVQGSKVQGSSEDTETKTATAEEPAAQTVKMEPKSEKKEEPKSEKKEEPKGQKVNPGGSKPKTTKGKQETKGHKLTYSTYMNGTKEQGRISGFAETDAAYLAGRDFHGSAYPVKGVLCLSFGKAYKDFARQLCDALNAGKTVDECKAMLEKYDAERAQKKAEWRAKREARNANANESEKTGGKTYTEAEVADLLKRVMEGDAEAMRIVNAMQKAA